MPAKCLERASLAAASAALALLVLAGAVCGAACGGSQTEAQTSAPATTSPPTEPEEPATADEDMGLLDVMGDSGIEILLDGKPIGKTPISAYKVTPGRHDVTFIDEQNGNRTMTVTIEPNAATTVKSDLPPRIREQSAPDDGAKK